MKQTNMEFDQMRLTNSLEFYRESCQQTDQNENWSYSRLDELNEEQEMSDLSGLLHSSRVNNDQYHCEDILHDEMSQNNKYCLTNQSKIKTMKQR
jgi:hypothetical protein